MYVRMYEISIYDDTLKYFQHHLSRADCGRALILTNIPYLEFLYSWLGTYIPAGFATVLNPAYVRRTSP